VKASEFMTKEVISLTPDKTVEDAAKLMLKKNISIVPIVDSTSHLVGVVTESDFIGKNADIPHALASIKRLLGQIFYHDGVEQIFQNAKKMALEKVMSNNPKFASPDDSLDKIVDQMGRFNLKRIPVVKDGKLVGVITRHDIIRAFTMLNGSMAG
jgi:CBS domain-containing protein